MEEQKPKLLFLPNWEQCENCGNWHPKSVLKICIRCGKNLCHNCHRTHEASVVCDGGEPGA